MIAYISTIGTVRTTNVVPHGDLSRIFFCCIHFWLKILVAHSYLIIERIEHMDEEERPSLVMHHIERMDDERRQRIKALIRDVEGVRADLDESTSRSIKDLIGELRQLVEYSRRRILFSSSLRPEFSLWNWQRKRRMHLTLLFANTAKIWSL